MSKKNMDATINYTEIDNVKSLLQKFPDKTKSAEIRAFVKSSVEIRDTAKANLISKYKKTGRNKYSDNLEDAIRVIKVRDTNDVVSTGVHILGIRKSSSGTFRTRFFESGTVNRFKKNKAYTGKLSAKLFFSSAIGNAETILTKNIDVEIDKIINEFDNSNK